MNLRRELEEDWEAVNDLHRKAFGEHGTAVAALVDALRGPVVGEDGLSLVAEQAGQILGHLMLTPSLLDAPDRLLEVQVLSPVGVLPPYQRRGIGTALIRHALAIMIERHVPVVFLEGSPDYYSRFGFAAGAPLGFRKPSLRIPDAAFQALRLPAYEAWMVGTLVYAEAFWRHDAVGLRPQSVGSSGMLSDRFRAAVEAGDIAGSADLFAEDAVFRSPVVYRPYAGRDTVLRVLEAAERVLGLGGHFRYVHQLEDSDARVAILEFATEVNGRQVEGIDKLTFDGDGRIAELKVMLRPASALQVVGARMAEEFSRLGLAGPA